MGRLGRHLDRHGARGEAARRSRESGVSRLSHVGPLLIAAYLLAAPAPLPVARAARPVSFPSPSGRPRSARRLASPASPSAIWARVTIAANWSSDVQLKRGHELIVAGPYAHVRHPIYTGLLMMFAGTALAVGEWRAALAVAVAAAAFWLKLRREEALMRRQFGEAYARYAARVPPLIPFVG